MAAQIQEPPEGFTLHKSGSPYLDHNGPIYFKGAGHDLAVGVYITEKHVNGVGVAHGGFIATLADVALAGACATVTDPPGGGLTVSLTVDFTGVAILGSWVQSYIEIHKDHGTLKFANVYLICNEKSIARASAVFRGSDYSTAE